ncbi:hypothetical protein PN36_34615 [Candidatus Thiomargarita nelsonii]|uniref:Uncharacterized protein n=1 Tax=Candidatus Thiomargarita nelsonii TaxID=1003181 RepID=A0A4E0QQ22_9GAMM|nr:hypothetical protein PN36_34615 [Candidatus Thiomargarita nelsonii]
MFTLIFTIITTPHIFAQSKTPSDSSFLGDLPWITGFKVSTALQPTLELYGTFHSMGVIITIAESDDPDSDATATVTYNISGGVERTAFPLTRVNETRFAGSLFWLEPGTSYEVAVSFSDPDGDPLDGQIVAGTYSTRAEITIPAPNSSYIVTPDGSGTTCSLTTPCSLVEGLNQAQAGDEVLLRDGIYYQGEMELLRSGTNGAPIVIRSYPNESAILDGGDPVTYGWTDQGGGVYQTTVNVPDTHLVTANGERLYPYQSFDDLQTLKWDISGFYVDGVTLYVHLVGNANPADITMVISRFNHSFLVERDFIYISGLTFRHYGQGSYAKAIYFNNASDNLVQNSIFAINDLGIGIKRDSHRNVIQESEFYDTNFMWPWDAVKEEGQLETGGVNFYSPTTGRGNVIRRNSFHDYFDGFTSCPNDNGDATNETDVYENLVYNAGDDGLSADGTCSNVRIWGNRFYNVLVGISLAPVEEGPVYVMRNLIYRTGAGNSIYSGYPFKFNSGGPPSGVMYIFHNTADAVYPGNNGFYIKSPGSWEMIYARNNIWVGTEYAFESYNTSQPLDMDYDNLWNHGGNLARWNSTTYATLPDFTAGTGQEAHGLAVTSRFADPANGDYTLSATSALIDQGVILPGINDGYAGTAPDIGAFEWDGVIQKPLPRNDVIIDFGYPHGLWVWMNNDSWSFLHSLSPKSMAIGYLDNNKKDELIIDFDSQYGLWLLMNNNNWVSLHNLSADSLVSGDLDGGGQDEVLIDFGDTYGIWVRMNNSSWTQLHTLSPESMITGDMDGNGQDEVLIDFGSLYGIWVRMNNSNWTQLHTLSPESMITGDMDGNGLDEVVIDFGETIGIWVRMNNSGWAQLHTLSPNSMVTGDLDGSGQDEVVINFGDTYGLWIRMNNSSWVQLHSLSAETLVTGDLDSNGKDEVIIDFGSQYGLWVRMNNSRWVQLHTLSAESLVTGNIDGVSSVVSNITTQEGPAELDNAAPLPEAEHKSLLAE